VSFGFAGLKSRFAGGVDLQGARVGGALNLAGITIAELDLTGAVVDGVLKLDDTTTWWPPAEPNSPQLKLVNAKVGPLQDTIADQLNLSSDLPDRPGRGGKDADNTGVSGDGFLDKLRRVLSICSSDDHPPSHGWPTVGAMQLEGFTYSHLPRTDPDVPERGVGWWLWWLKRDPEFSTQPYVQLASVMAAHGDQDNAAAVQFFGRVRETCNAWNTDQYARGLFLTVLGFFIGYGIGHYMLVIVFVWLVVLTLSGVLLLKFAPGSQDKSLWWRFGASFARVLPGIQIRKEFSDFFDEPGKLNARQVLAFIIILLLGWILGLFFVAAVTGLMQHA
jgi:hypothetical protein